MEKILYFSLFYISSFFFFLDTFFSIFGNFFSFYFFLFHKCNSKGKKKKKTFKPTDLHAGNLFRIKFRSLAFD